MCLASPAHAASEVHKDAWSILSERQFHHQGASWLDSLGNAIGHFFDRVVGAFLGSNGLTVGGVIVAALLVLGGLYVASRFAGRVRRDPGIDLWETEPGSRRPADWTAEAERHEAAGEWRLALRAYYRALVARLAERGVVEEIPGRTAREYERQVSERLPPASRPFNEASDIFESVWYGYEPSGQPETERFKELAQSVLEGSRS